MSPLPFPISLPAPMTPHPPHPILCWKHESFGVKVTKGSERKSPELADGGLLKGVVATFIVPAHFPLLGLSVCLAEHITFYVELSWECSAKSVSTSRPQSSSVSYIWWLKKCILGKERPGCGGKRWSSWLRAVSRSWENELGVVLSFHRHTAIKDPRNTLTMCVIQSQRCFPY